MPLLVLIYSLAFSLYPGVTSVGFVFPDDDKPKTESKTAVKTYMSTHAISAEGWELRAEPIFWKKIMELSPDSLVLNIARTRQILEILDKTEWDKNSDEEKSAYRDSLRQKHGLDAEERIYATTGKNHFYHFDLVIPTIPEGLQAFEANNTDPWYAQAILLIESPGQLKKSRTGAYGPFQLMSGVARTQGLRVDRYVDERADFDRAAFAASSLIRKVCIPEAKKILDRHEMNYTESDLWFRLFVMHVYHAGAGNVSAVVNKINPKENCISGQDLIYTMWHSKARAFGNNSQNYTQLALAANMILHDKLVSSGEQFAFYSTP